MTQSLHRLASELKVPVKHLERLCFSGSDLYERFELGGRPISSPMPELKAVQFKALESLSSIEVSPWSHGLTRGRSIITNASQHLNRQVVINTDISGFFPSVSDRMVRMALSHHYAPHEAYALSMLCTEKRCYSRSLPQGAPTSPLLANLVCWPLDSAMASMAERYGYTYTRYADDITFSGDEASRIAGIVKHCRRLLIYYKFSMNERKLRVMRRGCGRMEVTGIDVSGDRLDVTPSLKRRIARWAESERREGRDPMDSPKILGALSFVESVKR